MSWQPRRYHEGGYLIIDHRASPGMSAEDARLAGFDPNGVKEGAMFEGGTLTCSHCMTTYLKRLDRVRPRERCEKCDHYVCDFCYAKMQEPDYIHVPFQALIDMMR